MSTAERKKLESKALECGFPSAQLSWARDSKLQSFIALNQQRSVEEDESEEEEEEEKVKEPKLLFPVAETIDSFTDFVQEKFINREQEIIDNDILTELLSKNKILVDMNTVNSILSNQVKTLGVITSFDSDDLKRLKHSKVYASVQLDHQSLKGPTKNPLVQIVRLQSAIVARLEDVVGRREQVLEESQDLDKSDEKFFRNKLILLRSFLSVQKQKLVYFTETIQSNKFGNQIFDDAKSNLRL